jgi:hypothetical protein
MSSLVELRLLPEGEPRTQLRTLQQQVLNEFMWIRQHDAKHLPVDKDSYKRFMGVFLASLYVFSPQGRTQGLDDLKFGQAQDLLSTGFVQTTKFKTQAKWGFQPVTLSEESKELLIIYLRSFRPVASGPLPSQPSDALFLNYIGCPHPDIGKELTSFFLNTCNLHITATRIRSVVETAAEEMYRGGEITLKTRKSVEAINGHTSAVVQNYYLQMDRASDVHSAREFFSQASSPAGPVQVPFSSISSSLEPTSPHGLRIQHDSAVSSMITVPDNVDDDAQGIADDDSLQPIPLGPVGSGWAPREGTRHLNWGTSHPEYHRRAVKKVKWSAQELQYIEEWINKDKQGDSNLPVSRCLAAIRLDPRAVHIFHTHHILNSQRLRNGYDSVLKRKSLQLEVFDVQSEQS